MSVIDLSDRKTDLRRMAFAARKAARSDSKSTRACAHLAAYVSGLPGSGIVSGYMAIQTEIDPMRAMTALFDQGRNLCVPVIQGRGKPLLFREWSPGCGMIEGDFGALIPRSGDFVMPDICVVPLVAYDARGHRLGYGGGFYDRTLKLLRASNPRTHAVGLAFEGQEVACVPTDPNDQPLDAIVTEQGVRPFRT